MVHSEQLCPVHKSLNIGVNSKKVTEYPRKIEWFSFIDPIIKSVPIKTDTTHTANAHALNALINLQKKEYEVLFYG